MAPLHSGSTTLVPLVLLGIVVARTALRPREVGHQSQVLARQGRDDRILQDELLQDELARTLEEVGLHTALLTLLKGITPAPVLLVVDMDHAEGSPSFYDHGVHPPRGGTGHIPQL